MNTNRIVSWLGSAALAFNAGAKDLSFSYDVLPVLSDNCFKCHGPDEKGRQGELRLDFQASAFGKGKSGAIAIVPGNADASELVKRITSGNPEKIMPPPKSLRTLSQEQITVLRDWINAGAKWGKHWAYEAPARPEVPVVPGASQPVDAFVRAMLAGEKIEPSPEADRTTLLRRATFDLTGLPPTLAELDAFLADASTNAYEKMVDRLLASPAYGERWCWDWLDASRYADSNGFQGDPDRTMWPWRDWVIRQINANRPYDQFVIEQLAGDLFTNATPDQIVASAFNRNHMHNGEGGRIAEETRVENVFDRTETFGTVFLGLTIGCARCHDHKFDPITQREYYQFFDYFNQTSERGNNGNGQITPVLDLTTPEEKARLAELKKSDKPEDKKEREKLDKETVRVMIMDELPKRRDTYILVKGAYDAPTTNKVIAGVPAVLPRLPADAPTNRLTLARWLFASENPLTARVAVNRFWQAFFGIGLVKTPDDFGVQGERPAHHELLDWLATEFVRTGWDVKALQKTIVMSATYRQSSKVSQADWERDPENRLLARGPRFRLPSWMLRDEALAAGGLLVPQVGGPPVRPYQPAGIWEEATFGNTKYAQDHDDKLYRRTLYIFWRRIVGPTMLFDNAARQTCSVKTLRTDTPLHALTTLNDITYTEAARAMAQRVMTAASAVDARIALAFRIATARNPTPEESAILEQRLDALKKAYSADADATKKLLAVGESKRDEKLDAAEHAAYTELCSLILNLDETITKQ